MKPQLVLLIALSITSVVHADDTFRATLLHPRDPDVIRGSAALTLYERQLRYSVEFDSDGVPQQPVILVLGGDLLPLPITGGAVSIHEPGSPEPDPDWFPGRVVFWGEATVSDLQADFLRSGDGYLGFGDWRGQIAVIPEPGTWILAAIAIGVTTVLWRRHPLSLCRASDP